MRGESLQVLDRVLRRVVQELADQSQTFMVADMSLGFAAQRSPVDHMLQICAYERRRDGGNDTECAKRHCSRGEPVYSL